jgi:hypothetical protein
MLGPQSVFLWGFWMSEQTIIFLKYSNRLAFIIEVEGVYHAVRGESLDTR